MELPAGILGGLPSRCGARVCAVRGLCSSHQYGRSNAARSGLGRAGAIGARPIVSLGDKPGTTHWAHNLGASHGLLLPSMTNDTPGELYVRGAARDASEAQPAPPEVMRRESTCRS